MQQEIKPVSHGQGASSPSQENKHTHGQLGMESQALSQRGVSSAAGAPRSADRFLAGGSMGGDMTVAVPQRKGVGTWCLERNSRLAQMVNNLPAMQETQVRSLAQENPLEKGMATHSYILAWRIP